MGVTLAKLQHRAGIGQRRDQLRAVAARFEAFEAAVHVLLHGERRILKVVRRQHAQHSLGLDHRVRLALAGEMRRAGLHRHVRAAELLGLDVLLHGGSQHLRAGHHQRARRFGHDHHVGELRHHGGRADARTEHQRNHRHNATQASHVREHIGIRLQRGRALAHARAVAVAHGDNRGAGLASLLKNFDDLLRLLRAHRAVHHGEILRKDKHRAAVYRAASGHNAGVLREHALLDEAAAVQQQRNALARSLLAALLLLLNASGTLFENSLLAREHLAEILKGAHSTIASVIV